MRCATDWRRMAVLLMTSSLLLGACASGQEEQVQDQLSEVAVIPEDTGPVPSELVSAVPSEPTGGAPSLAGDLVSCDPNSTELAASATVAVEIRDGEISLASDEVVAGTIRFEVTNAGDVPHELLIVLAGDPEALPRADTGGVDESSIEEGTVLGEVGVFPAGQTCPGVFDLIPGDYLLFCNVVVGDEGDNVSHFEQGEWVRFTAT